LKLSLRLALVIFVAMALTTLSATDLILPATSPYQAQMRIWMAARATGIVALVLLTIIVVIGIALSHPHQGRWKQAKRLFPWHESLWVFVTAFLTVHVVSLVVDEYAGVGLGGALVPGLSEYRTVPVALGVTGAYAFAVTVITARFTSLLPAGVWLKLHRLSAVVLALGWAHGVLAGTDSGALTLLYWAMAVAVLGAAAYRYWVMRVRGHARTPITERKPGSPRLTSRLLEEPDVEPQPAP
jgi:predicted ferric reductase